MCLNCFNTNNGLGMTYITETSVGILFSLFVTVCYIRYARTFGVSEMFLNTGVDVCGDTDWIMPTPAGVVSVLTCAKACLKNKDCEGVSFDDPTTICRMYGWFTTCDTNENKYKVFTKTVGAVECLDMTLNQSIYTNVALQKPVSASSYGISGIGRLVDGIVQASLFWYTQNQLNPYVTIDLQNSYTIAYVHIYNRLDCCLDRLSNFKISTGEETSSLNICVHHPGNIGTECLLRVLNLFECRGRHVRLQAFVSNFINLIEIEVYTKL